MAHGAASSSGYRGPVTTEDFDDDPVHGVLHRPGSVPRGAVALTHGAGGNCDAAILRQLCGAFAEAGFLALRFDLPFRRRHPKGPPQPSRAAEDRAGIAAAAAAMRACTCGPLVLGGVSYGGRQTSMLAAEQPGVADALVLLSYPLHPPGKPEKARTEHLPALAVPTVFTHGDRDPFGTLDEMRAALPLIPAPVLLVPVTGAAHDLGKARTDPAPSIVHAVSGLLSDTSSRA
ncbi:alpha/beta hydrolase [Rhodococcus sp. CSLK01-03]|uniref:Alpha/beta hydrolase n=1 Tax=Rhodococcus indonesiensis TaxID=3055869 RepID=A0ABT7RTW2_9NOCA|nr:alpha/beta family hydrolase [Rhodococcus indonesiensis]MDM7490649.1 alpha/beta hydrolase [Rhodococcus indonesiensis]